MSYEWDGAKASANELKHGVAFADAVGVFEDPNAITIRDEDEEEERYVTLGLDFLGRVLVVSYTWRGEETDSDHLGANCDAHRDSNLRRRCNMKKEYDFSKGKRGRVVPAPTGKERITIRLDEDILQWFRDEVDSRGGGNYQTLINAALREHISGNRESLEDVVRRVLREELKTKAS